MTKLAIFDIDGTLFEGNMGIEFLKVLIKKGMFSKEIGNGIFGWYAKYKSGEVEKSIVVDEIYRLYALGMTGLDKDKINETAHETWNAISDKVYPFTKELIKLLKDFRVVLLSGSPIEMVSIFGKNIEIEDFIAGTLEIVDNKYTGKIISYPGSAEQKVEEINKFIKNKNIEVDWQNSIGMGDNERDLGILKLVGFPIAFEPNEKLTIESKKNGFAILDRNNILEYFREKILTKGI